MFSLKFLKKCVNFISLGYFFREKKEDFPKSKSGLWERDLLVNALLQDLRRSAPQLKVRFLAMGGDVVHLRDETKVFTWCRGDVLMGIHRMMTGRPQSWIGVRNYFPGIPWCVEELDARAERSRNSLRAHRSA